MNNTTDTLPERLVTFRAQNRFSQELMGELLGVSQQVYSNRENGKNKKYEPDFLKKADGLLAGTLDESQKQILKSHKIVEYTIKFVTSTTIKPTSNAFPLGPIDDEETETTKSGNKFIDLGSGQYAMLVPLVSEYAYNGYLVGFRDPEYLESLPRHTIIVNERHHGKYCTFVARGDSNNNGEPDAIEEGDKVTGRSISKQYWKSKLHTHRYKEFVINHKEGILIKEIIAHDVENGIITIHAKNPDKKLYPDVQINLADVDEIFNVVEVSKPRR